VEGIQSISARPPKQDELFSEAANSFGPALARLVSAYEADPEKRQDLSQDIQLQLWRSLANFDGRCSLRTWVYRVAHNVASSYLIRERRSRVPFVSLDDLESQMEFAHPGPNQGQHWKLQQLEALIQKLRPLDRQIIVSYLEELDAAMIGEITGLAAPTVAMRIHRIKRILAKQVRQGEHHHE
jgi:RNA polymerase sigma-70 factor, ECF subfamily